MKAMKMITAATLTVLMVLLCMTMSVGETLPVVVSVTFVDPNSETVKEVKIGEAIAEPAIAPTVEGYDFRCWFNKARYEIHDFNEPIAKNTTLVAYFVKQDNAVQVRTVPEAVITNELAFNVAEISDDPVPLAETADPGTPEEASAPKEEKKEEPKEKQEEKAPKEEAPKEKTEEKAPKIEMQSKEITEEAPKEKTEEAPKEKPENAVPEQTAAEEPKAKEEPPKETPVSNVGSSENEAPATEIVEDVVIPEDETNAELPDVSIALIYEGDSVTIGEKVTFVAKANSPSALQWENSRDDGKTWHNISGATKRTMNIIVNEENFHYLWRLTAFY